MCKYFPIQYSTELILPGFIIIYLFIINASQGKRIEFIVLNIYTNHLNSIILIINYMPKIQYEIYAKVNIMLKF